MLYFDVGCAKAEGLFRKASIKDAFAIHGIGHEGVSLWSYGIANNGC